jgi:protein-tyrosine sulfotransferase
MSDNLPIVIVGCPRSGTTLLRRLLGAHPAIDCAGESFVLRAAVRFLSGETVAEGIDYGPLGGLAALGFAPDEVRARLRELAFGFHRELAAKAGKPRFAIKTAVDSFYLPQLRTLLDGQAKIVCLVRHGGDVTVSLSEFTQKMEGPIDELMPFLNAHRRFMPAYAAAWAKVTAEMLDAAEADPEHVFGLRYEDLVDEPEAVLGELFEFLEQPCNVPALLGEAFRPKDVAGLGDYKTFATKRLERGSIGQWQNLAPRVQAEIAPLLNPVLERAGYEPLSAEASSADAMRLHELAMMYQTAKDREA